MNIDFTEMARQSKSHGWRALEKAFVEGEDFWEFDSGNSGEDDLLILEAGTDEDEIRADLQCYFGVGPEVWDTDQANHWSLTKLSRDEIAGRWPK